MNALELYQAGRIDDALQALNGALRDDPGNVRLRTFLFELLCFGGEFDRAEKQLDVVARSSKDAEMGAMLYRSALHAERTRQEMFLAGTPMQGAPPRSDLTGMLNGTPFRSLADADPRLGARLEVFAAGQYTWLPLEHIASLSIEPPKRLRDLIWAPARVKAGPKFQDFEFGEVLIPVLYPLSWQHPEWEVRLGRSTEWVAREDGTEVLMGQKLIQIDDELVPILEVRELEIASQSDQD